MPETIVATPISTITTNDVKVTTTPAPTPTPQAEPDLITKVTQFKRQEERKPEDTGGTFKEFDDIKDPLQRDLLIKREKERVADYTRKTQDLARQREDFNKQKQESESWTPERVKSLLNNQQFIQSAQQVTAYQNPTNSGLTDAEFSTLTEKEQQGLVQMKSQINELQASNYVALVTQKDVQLQSRYSDYDSAKINSAFQDLIKMNAIDIREHIYKGISHDEHVKAAYEMGKSEALNKNQERKDGMTTIGSETVNSSDVPKRNEGENPRSYLERILQFRSAQFKK